MGMYKSGDIYYIETIDLIIDWKWEVKEREVSRMTRQPPMSTGVIGGDISRYREQ